MRVLVIEDEKKLASFIAKGMQQEGYAVDIAHDGVEGSYQALNFEYDVVILDLMLPKLSGLDVLKAIRAQKTKASVLILTARGSVEDRITGLDAGADDYLVKPFAITELSARVRALLRRGGQQDSKLKVADLEMDTSLRLVRRGGEKINLTLKEYSLLEFLLRSVHRPVTRAMIIEHVWDIHFDSISNVVDVQINSLRNKIDKGFSPPLIHTLRGVGYLLTDKHP